MTVSPGEASATEGILGQNDEGLMTSQAGFERLWLGYARRVLSMPCGCTCDACIRWPGYLGSEYECGRVLLVGAIGMDPVMKPLVTVKAD